MQQVAQKVDRDFGGVQMRTMEMLGMHSEEFRQKTVKMADQVQDLDMKVDQIEHDNDHLRDDLKSASETLGKLSQQCVDLNEQVQKLDGQVVDCSGFEKKQKLFSSQLEHFEKRLAHEEENNRQFGQFIVRFLPVTYMINLAEHMLHCGHPGALLNLDAFLDQQAQTEIKPIKTRKYNLVADIDDFKDKLLKKFEETREAVKRQIAPAKEQEKKDLERKAVLLEAKVDTRIAALETAVKAFESEVKTQQNEAKLRLEKLQNELDSGMNSAMKSSKTRKKEKLLKQLGKSPARGTDESQGEGSVAEVVSPPKKEKKGKTKRADKQALAASK